MLFGWISEAGTTESPCIIVSLFLVFASLAYAYNIWNTVPTHYIDTVVEGESFPEGLIEGP